MSTDSSSGVHLEAIEQRVLGCLLEKEVTVPASYPLSLNALRTACNQASSRDPVTDYDDRTLLECLKGLKERELIRTVWAGRGSRAIKYHQLLSERLDLDAAERALITVLLLRGPQSAGELRTRTERLHGFTDRAAAEACLREMAAREVPLVRELERAAGQHDPRWIHLLGPVASATPVAPPAAVDREVVLAQGHQERDAKVRISWDAYAAEYAERFIDELDDKPLDTWLLERVAMLSGKDPVLEVGCGPGHVCAYLAEFDADVTGIDISPAMIDQARARFPDLAFEVGNQANLMRPPRAHGWGAIVSCHSTIHLAPSELPPLFAEFARVLRPGGWVLLIVRLGEEVQYVYVDPETGRGGPQPVEPGDVSVGVVLHDPEQVLQAVRAAGFVDVEWYVRGAYPDEPDPTKLLVLARTPR